MARNSDDNGKSSSGALKGPPPYGGARYDPHGSGPTTPRDEQSRDHLKEQDWDKPCGDPSDTPRPKG